MLAPFDTTLLTDFVKAVVVECGVKLGTLVSVTLSRSEHPWLSLLSCETVPEPVLLAFPTLEVFIPGWSDTFAVYL